MCKQICINQDTWQNQVIIFFLKMDYPYSYRNIGSKNSQQLRSYEARQSQNSPFPSRLKSYKKEEGRMSHSKNQPAIGQEYQQYDQDHLQSQGANIFPNQGQYPYSSYQQRNPENLNRIYGQKSHVLNNLRMERDGIKQTQHFYDGVRNVKIILNALNEKAKGQTQLIDCARRLNEDKERKLAFINDADAYQSQVQRHIDYMTHRKEDKEWSMNTQMQLRAQNLQEQLRYMTKKLEEEKSRHARDQKFYMDKVTEMRIDLKQKEQKLKKLNSDLFSLYKQNHRQNGINDRQSKQVRKYNQEQHIVLSQRNLNLNGFQQKFVGAMQVRNQSRQIIDRVQKDQILAVFRCQSSSKFINGFQCIYNSGKQGKQHFANIETQGLRHRNQRNNIQSGHYQNQYGFQASNFSFDQIDMKDVLSIKVFYRHKIVGMLFDVRGGHEQHRRNFQITIGDCTPYVCDQLIQNDYELMNLARKRKKIITISSHWEKNDMVGISIFFKDTEENGTYKTRQRLVGKVKSEQKQHQRSPGFSTQRQQHKFRNQIRSAYKGEQSKGNTENMKNVSNILDNPQLLKTLLKQSNRKNSKGDTRIIAQNLQTQREQVLQLQEQPSFDQLDQTTDEIVKNEYIKIQKAMLQKNAEKRLQEVDFFVLDNSIRESTVGTMRDHTIQNKMDIFNHVLECKFTDIIVAAFQHRPRVDDQFVKVLMQKRGQQIRKKNINLWGFTELISQVKDGCMIAETKPIALQKMETLGVNNPIFEIDLADKRVDWDKFKIEDLCEITLKWIRWSKKNLKKHGKQSQVAINLRDFPLAMVESQISLKVLEYVGFLSSLQAEDKLFAILIEDATGKFIPHQLGTWVKATKNMMNAKGWKEGKLLVHIHQKWGLAGDTQLQCIINGADGVWASVCQQGAALGHASSTVTLMNLVRFNNQKLTKKYNCSNLRKASRQVTKITTGQYPHPRQPIVGERALDLVFDFAGIAGGIDTQQFNLEKFFGEERALRITTMASNERIKQKLEKLFGKDQAKFNLQVAEKMHAKMIQNLDQNNKFEYSSPHGLIMLYAQSGGTMDDQMQQKLELLQSQQKQNQKRYIPVFNDVKDIWDRWNLVENKNNHEDSLEYDSFYHAFLERFFGCYRCEHTFKALKAIDMNKDGNVDWNQFKFYIKWALKQFPDQIQTAEQCIQLAVKKGIIPDMQDVIVDRIVNGTQKEYGKPGSSKSEKYKQMSKIFADWRKKQSKVN